MLLPSGPGHMMSEDFQSPLDHPDASRAEEDADDVALASFLVNAADRLRTQMAKVIVGQTDVVEQLLIAVFAGGHCLLEGVPGLAKTSMVRALASSMDLSFRRIQFTPDLMPADITGTDIIQENPESGRRELVFQPGPLFAQMLLADEINRAPPKTQSALLEAMQEHSVTSGGRTMTLEEPFFVLATQNPIEQEGTYPLPEAQRDRFLFQVKVDYPDRAQEWEIVERTTGACVAVVEPVIAGPDILRCQRVVRRVPVPDHVMAFVLDLVRGTRPGQSEAIPALCSLLEWGAGPRASQTLVLASKVRALLCGRFHVTTDDIEALARPVLRHRIVPSYAAEAEGVSADQIVGRALETVAQTRPAARLQ